MSVQAHPLQWPRGRPRRNASNRKSPKFNKKEWRAGEAEGHGWHEAKDLTIADAVKRLFDEMDRIRARSVVISSNLEIRQDGLPRSGQRAPVDPGVCVYFELAGKPRAMPCDTYTSVTGNIAAIAAHVAATRAIERHGVATVAEMFEGFAALPAPGAGRPWWEVLGIPSGATPEQIEDAYRAKAKEHHPDAGGSSDRMAELNRARQEARLA